MQLSLQLSKLQGTTSYFDGNMGRVGVKSDTVKMWKDSIRYIVVIFQTAILRMECPRETRPMQCPVFAFMVVGKGLILLPNLFSF